MDFSFGSIPLGKKNLQRSRPFKQFNDKLTSLLKTVKTTDDEFLKEKLEGAVGNLVKQKDKFLKQGMFSTLYTSSPQFKSLQSQLGSLQNDVGLATAGLGKFTKEKFARTQLREQFNILSDQPGAAQTIMTNRSALGV